MSELQGPPSAEAAAEPVQDDTFTVLDLVLVRRRRLIVATTGIAAVVLLVYNILAMAIDPESPLNLLPTWFTASVTVSIADDGPDYGAGAATLLSRIPDTGAWPTSQACWLREPARTPAARRSCSSAGKS